MALDRMADKYFVCHMPGKYIKSTIYRHLLLGLAAVLVLPSAGHSANVTKSEITKNEIKKIIVKAARTGRKAAIRPIEPVKKNATLFAWPLKRALISSIFGRRRRRGGHVHTGLDLVAARGTAIHAIEKGEVIFAGWKGRYGRLVIIRHTKAVSYYAHNSRIAVKRGQQVDRGQKIAEAGRTGAATGCHLHLEIRIDGKPVNPLFLLDTRNDIAFMHKFEQRISLRRTKARIAAMKKEQKFANNREHSSEPTTVKSGHSAQGDNI